MEAIAKEIEKFWPPAVSFKEEDNKGKGKKKKDDDDDDTKYASFDVPLDADDSENSQEVKQKIAKVSNPTPEEWCKLRIELAELFISMGYVDNPLKQSKLIKTVLYGKILEVWNTNFKKHWTDHEAGWDAATLEADRTLALDKVIDACACYVFPDKEGSARAQRRYMRNNLYMGSMDPEKWTERLEVMNGYFPYFPQERVTARNNAAGAQMRTPPPLPWDELIDIQDYAKPIDFHIAMMAQGKKPHTFDSVEESTQFLKQLYDAAKLQRKVAAAAASKGGNGGNTSRGGRNKRKGGRNGNGNGDSNKESTKPGLVVCKFCNRKGHTEDKCWDKNPDLRPAKKTRTGGRNKQESSNHVTISTKDLKKLVAQAASSSRKRPNKKKRTIVRVDSSDSEDSVASAQNFLAQLKVAEPDEVDGKCTNRCMCNDHSHTVETNFALSSLNDGSDSESSNSEDDESISSECRSQKCYNKLKKENAYPFSPAGQRPNKKSKLTHYTAEVVLELKDRYGNLRPVRALLDTGTSSSIVLREFVPDGQISRFKSTRTTWKTMGGSFETRRKGQVKFKFPELDTNTAVTWSMHVDDLHKPKDTQYDVILGMDLMIEIGIFINTRDKVVEWNDFTTPLKEKGELNMGNNMEAIYHLSQEAPLLREAEKRQTEVKYWMPTTPK